VMGELIPEFNSQAIRNRDLWLTRVDEESVPTIVQFMELHDSGQVVVIDFLGQTSIMNFTRGEPLDLIEERAAEIIIRDLKRYG